MKALDMRHPLNLSHFSHKDKPVESIQSVNQTGRRYDKPDGFWVSVDGEQDWLEWNRSEEFYDLDRAYDRYRVELAPDAHILHLSEPEHLVEFVEEYGMESRAGSFLSRDHRMDWDRLAYEYQGIIIAPYQWEHRLNLSFYYGWDCASGAIWDASAIKAVRQLVEIEVSA